MTIERWRLERWRRLVVCAMPDGVPASATQIARMICDIGHKTPNTVVLRALREMRAAGMVVLVGRQAGWVLTDFGKEARSLVLAEERECNGKGC